MGDMKKEIIFEVIMVIALIGICNALPAGPGSPSLPSDTSYVNLRIISPNDNYQTSINNVNFTFDASSDSGLIDRCELIVNNNVVKSENNINGSKINYISYTLSNGESSWKIKCYSGDAVNESLSRSINIGSSCSNSCDNNGERICSGNGFKSCGDLNNDGCLEWSVITGCGSNQQCVSGSCVNNLPACTENDWSSSVSPSSCPQNSQQLRTWTLIGNCAGGIFHSNENITCSTQSSCTSFTYSSWSVCSSSGVQTRTVSSSSPGGCSGGNPILSQQCSYIPSCVENDWRASLNPLTCPLSNTQTKTWTLIGNCSGGVQKTTESVSCNSQSVTCTNFTYSDYSECSLSNVQTREVLLRFPANCTGGNLVISSSCSYNDYLKRIIGFNSNINSENVSLLKENAPIIEFKKIKNP